MMWFTRKKVDESQLAEDILKASLSISNPSGTPEESEVEKARRDLMIAQLEALHTVKTPLSKPAPCPKVPIEKQDTDGEASVEDKSTGRTAFSQPPNLPSPQNQQIPQDRQSLSRQRNPQILRIPTLQSDLQTLLEEIVRHDIDRYNTSP